jgi:3-methyladenine DNA glycosylase Tag
VNTKHAICEAQEYQALFPDIDQMVSRVNEFRIDPEFQNEVNARANSKPDFALSDIEILKKFVYLIAYSQQANSQRVTKLVQSGTFDEIFKGYSLQNVASLNRDTILQQYWSKIGAIRYQKKIGSIIGCAKALLKVQSGYTSFMAYLQKVEIPRTIKTEEELQEFWEKFAQVRKDLNEAKMPFFGNFTSLCHLLLDLGYDCAKPDSAVMKAAVKLRIVSALEKQGYSNKYPVFPEHQLKKVICTMQLYGMCRDLRTPVIDFYLLIHGEQKGARAYVRFAYYR